MGFFFSSTNLSGDRSWDFVGREQGVRLRAVKVAAARFVWEGGREMANYWWYISGRRWKGLSLGESESDDNFASDSECKGESGRCLFCLGGRERITDDTYPAGDSFKGIIFYLQMKVKVVTDLPWERAQMHNRYINVLIQEILGWLDILMYKINWVLLCLLLQQELFSSYYAPLLVQQQASFWDFHSSKGHSVTIVENSLQIYTGFNALTQYYAIPYNASQYHAISCTLQMQQHMLERTYIPRRPCKHCTWFCQKKSYAIEYANNNKNKSKWKRKLI